MFHFNSIHYKTHVNIWQSPVRLIKRSVLYIQLVHLFQYSYYTEAANITYITITLISLVSIHNDVASALTSGSYVISNRYQRYVFSESVVPRQQIFLLLLGSQ